MTEVEEEKAGSVRREREVRRSWGAGWGEQETGVGIIPDGVNIYSKEFFQS